jgi:hypothetical protein
MATIAVCSFAMAAPDDEGISKAIRRFRMQSFQSFRSNRREYDRRVSYAQDIIRQWSRLGAPASERSSLLEFLDQAAVAARRGQPMPKFEFSKAAMSVKVHRRANPAGSDRRRKRRAPTDIVAPELPVLPRQPDRDWAPPRAGKTNRTVASLSTVRLESRVPRATRYRMASRPVPASPITHQQRSSSPAAAISSKTARGNTADESPVDLTLLAARIRASNLKLSEVESELMARGQWDVQRLEPLVHQFDEILSGRRLSRLYYDALNDSERKQLFTAISPPQPVLSLLSQRWFEARVASSDAAAEGEWPNDDVDSNRLESIARTIDLWKSEYPGYRN